MTPFPVLSRPFSVGKARSTCTGHRNESYPVTEHIHVYTHVEYTQDEIRQKKIVFVCKINTKQLIHRPVLSSINLKQGIHVL